MKEYFIVNENFPSDFDKDDMIDLCKIVEREPVFINLNRYGERTTGIQKGNGRYVKAIEDLLLTRRLKRTLVVNKNNQKQLAKI